MLFLILATVITVIAQIKVNAAISKYSQINSSRGITGADVARELLRINGIHDVNIEPIGGKLSDHYDPTRKTIRLSTDIFNGRSIAAISVAAHETGHAVQHNKGYVPLAFRSSIFPLVNFGSKMSWPLIMLGLLFGAFSGSNVILLIGIVLFLFVVLFQIVTLPVEFNASSRAIKMLRENALLAENEIFGAKQVLNAAAMTYVAAASVSILNLLRLLLILNRRNN